MITRATYKKNGYKDNRSAAEICSETNRWNIVRAGIQGLMKHKLMELAAADQYQRVKRRVTLLGAQKK